MEISIVGSGNVAWHLAKFFHQNGHRIGTIYNRTMATGQQLAAEVEAGFLPLNGEISSKSDLLILAVKDDVIVETVAKIQPNSGTIVLHTAGATPLSVLDKFDRYGVIYPPQSLSKEVTVNLAEIPFAIEGSDYQVQQHIIQLMQSLAPKSFACDTRQRLTLHVGAVFVNNFVNALYQIGYNLLADAELDFELLRPIILETAKKAQNNIPKDVQTGPASRNDKKTINRHLELLSNNETTKEIYQQLTSFLVKQGYNL